MGDVLFAVRMLVITVVIAVFLQIKIGGMTLEARAHSWVQTSSAVETLREVSRGAVKMIRVGYKTAVNLIDANLSSGFNRDQMAGSRSLNFGSAGRSEAYERDQEARRVQQKRVQDEAVHDKAPEAGSGSDE